MTTPKKASLLVYMLAALAATLTATLVLQGWRGSHATEILQTLPRKTTVVPLPDGLTLTEDFQIIQNRPLFYATRKLYAPVLPTSAAARLQLSSYQLLGTLLVPGGRGVAFLKKGQAGETTTVSTGDRLDGWAVKAIQTGRIVFGHRDQRLTLTTTAPSENTPAGQSVGVVRMRIGRPALHQMRAIHPQKHLPSPTAIVSRFLQEPSRGP